MQLIFMVSANRRVADTVKPIPLMKMQISKKNSRETLNIYSSGNTFKTNESNFKTTCFDKSIMENVRNIQF